MKNKIIFSLVLILSINSFLCDKPSAQYLDPVINPVWEYYSTNVLSAVSAGKGNTGVSSSGDVGFIYLNPATLNIDKKFQVNVGYNLRNATYLLIQNIFSFSIAAAYKINNNFQTGFAYQNDFSYDHSSQGGGIPESLTNFSFETHSIRLPIVYNLKWIRLGLNVNFMNLYGTKKGLSGNLWKIIPEAGMIVTPIPEFSFGLSFYPGFSGGIKYHYEHSNDEIIYDVKFPNRIKAGTEIRLYENRLKLSFDYHYANTSSLEFLKNQNNYHIGLDYSFNENWNFRCGFFTLYDLHPNSYYSYSGVRIEHADLGFVTFGTTYKYKNYSFNLGIMDNIVHNSQNISYFVINFGAGYEF